MIKLHTNIPHTPAFTPVDPNAHTHTRTRSRLPRDFKNPESRFSRRQRKHLPPPEVYCSFSIWTRSDVMTRFPLRYVCMLDAHRAKPSRSSTFIFWSIGSTIAERKFPERVLVSSISGRATQLSHGHERRRARHRTYVFSQRHLRNLGPRVVLSTGSELSN